MARKSKRMIAAEQAAPLSSYIYNVAVYVRLSIEDKYYKNGTDSLSTQEEMALEYLKDKADMKLYKVYSDNGETGSNFERQGFQDMMYDVYNGKVNCIIVKDLSRFGREYIEMGDYLEKIFPLIGVRFIAINDNYDNNVTAFDISVPIKNIINTLYAKDLSKKSAAALRIKQQNGEFIGSYAAYGYMKSKEDKHKIVIDEETAPVVKMIFEWKAQGLGYASMGRKLYDMGIMPPCRYRYDKGILKDKRYSDIVFWRRGTLKTILENEVYIGNMVQGRRKSRFFEGMNEVKVDKQDWSIVKNTHEPIISQELFDKVQKQLAMTKERYFENLGKYDKISNKENIFKTKVVCGDCGAPLTRYKSVKPENKNKVHYSYICPHHALYPTQCSFHSISENDLKKIVMGSIKMQMSYLSDMEIMFLNIASSKEVKKKQAGLTRAISDSLANISYIRTSRIRIASDLAKGLICDEEFNTIKNEFDEQLCAETEKLDGIRKKRDKFDKIISAPKWISELKKYHDSKMLTKDMIEAFIEKIIIYPDKRIEIMWTYSDKQSELMSLISGGEEIA